MPAPAPKLLDRVSLRAAFESLAGFGGGGDADRISDHLDGIGAALGIALQAVYDAHPGCPVCERWAAPGRGFPDHLPDCRLGVLQAIWADLASWKGV